MIDAKIKLEVDEEDLDALLASESQLREISIEFDAGMALTGEPRVIREWQLDSIGQKGINVVSKEGSTGK